MILRTTALVAIVAAFSVLTAAALLERGYWGIFAMHLESWAGTQVLTDLVILGILACIWMVFDGRRHGIPSWPFVAVTLAAGSFGPLFYLLWREFRPSREARE